MFTNVLRSGLTTLLLTFCAAASAAAQRPLNLAAVLDQTLRHHPVLARIDAQMRQLDPTVTLAQLSPPLSLGLDAENLGDEVSQRLETTLSLAGALEWGGQPHARAQVALSENDIQGLELAQQRRDVLAQAATRFIALAGSERGLAQARDAQKLARQIQASTLRRQQAGAASAADVQRASLALAQAEMAVSNAEQARDSARLALRLAIGRPDLVIESVSATLDRLPELPAQDELLALAPASPAVLLANARVNLARSQLELARRQARPSIGWTLGVRDEREREDQSLVLGFRLPLGQASRTQPLRERALAETQVAEYSREIAHLELQALLLDSWQALSAWKREADTLDTRLIPQGQAIVAALREGYTQGRYSLLELSSAQDHLNTLRGQRLSARMAYHQSWIELERLLGRSLILENQ